MGAESCLELPFCTNHLRSLLFLDFKGQYRQARISCPSLVLEDTRYMLPAGQKESSDLHLGTRYFKLKNLNSGYFAGAPIPLAGVHAALSFSVRDYHTCRILSRCMEATATPLAAGNGLTCMARIIITLCLSDIGRHYRVSGVQLVRRGQIQLGELDVPCTQIQHMWPGRNP